MFVLKSHPHIEMYLRIPTTSLIYPYSPGPNVDYRDSAVCPIEFFMPFICILLMFVLVQRSADLLYPMYVNDITHCRKYGHQTQTYLSGDVVFSSPVQTVENFKRQIQFWSKLLVRIW